LSPRNLSHSKAFLPAIAITIKNCNNEFLLRAAAFARVKTEAQSALSKELPMMTLPKFLGIGALCISFGGMPPAHAQSASEVTFTASPDEARVIAKDAFIYAYPMLFNYKTMYEQAVDPTDKTYVGGFGKFRNYSHPYGPENKDIVTPNNDTPYSWAWLDLRREPWVLTVPAVPKQRYFVFQWIDLFTYNFAYVGSRTTGNEGGHYLFAGPNWHGETPKGIDKVFRSETDC
jgi:hypothetical protein